MTADPALTAESRVVVRAVMDDIELLMAGAWGRLNANEHEMGQRILDRLRPLASDAPSVLDSTNDMPFPPAQGTTNG